MGLLDDRAGLVTGAGSGIGRASARAFAAEGAKVAVSDIDDHAGRETVELIRASGGEAFYVHADASSEPEVEALVAAVVERYGRLDWAHNNAGVGSPVAPVVEQKLEWFNAVLGLDLLGMMFALKHEVAQMLAQGHGGAIVNTASNAGLIGVVGMSPYVAAKAGVIGLTRTVALENAAFGIRVNALCPGIVGTPAVEAWVREVPEQAKAVEASIPMQRISTPEEQADVAVFLCSDKASYITGVALSVDGGQMIG
jgi:NAD(P)-dependent dehydrogenase (short-subunit alcohol dehydrogenase family)